MPPAAGTYTFHLTGSIKGQKLDEKFTSGPDTFSDTTDPAEVQYPLKHRAARSCRPGWTASSRA